MQRRPAPVNVFGILNIAFAVMAFFSLLMLAAMLFLGDRLADSPILKSNPVLAMMMNNPGYRMIQQISLVLGIPSTLMLLISGIGLLKLKPWARMLSIIYGIFAVVQCLALSVANYFYMLEPMLKQQPDMRDPQAAGAFFGAIGGTLGGCVGIIYPILLIIFMHRRSVVDALRAGPGAAPPPMPMG